jgi:leader peptidase (prepilin peptidase)/N-methyltransferase
MTPIFSTMPIALSGGTTLASVLTLVLSVVLWVGLSIFIGWTLSKVMHNQGMKTKPVFIMVISAVFSILLIARYGLSITAIQGLFLLYVLVYASCSDLTTHTVDDWLWLMVVALGLVSCSTIGFGSMLLGAVCVFVPQIAMALLPPHKTLGGADIKLSTALAFLLGGWRGIGAYLIGLVLAVIVMSIYNKYRCRCKKKPFALVPFLSIGAMIMFLI